MSHSKCQVTIPWGCVPAQPRNLLQAVPLASIVFCHSSVLPPMVARYLDIAYHASQWHDTVDHWGAHPHKDGVLNNPRIYCSCLIRLRTGALLFSKC